MGRIRKASQTDKGRMKRDDEARRTGKKLAAERGRCIGCVRFSDGAKYVDLGGDLPRIGKIYLCSTCLDRCRQVLGYASQTKFDKLQEAYDSKATEVEALTARVNELEEQLQVALSETFSDVVASLNK